MMKINKVNMLFLDNTENKDCWAGKLYLKNLKVNNLNLFIFLRFYHFIDVQSNVT